MATLSGAKCSVQKEEYDKRFRGVKRDPNDMMSQHFSEGDEFVVFGYTENIVKKTTPMTDFDGYP